MYDANKKLKEIDLDGILDGLSIPSTTASCKSRRQGIMVGEKREESEGASRRGASVRACLYTLTAGSVTLTAPWALRRARVRDERKKLLRRARSRGSLSRESRSAT